ncbi:hypothetical protein J6590_022416 [Homalodisca vitripennis]|nr:hypothetical protein J6590_022416 [Homalodisca vitripennis]
MVAATTIMSVTINCDNHTVSVSLISDMEVSRRPSVFLQSQCEVVVLYTECSYYNHCRSLSYLTWKFPAVRPSSYSLSARLSYYTRNVATTIMPVTINCDNHTVSVSLISDMEVSRRPSVFLQSQCEVVVLYTECSYYNHCRSLSYLTWKFPAVRPSSYSLSARLSYCTRNIATTIMSCWSLSYLTWKCPAVHPSSYSLSARLSYYTRNVATTIMSVTINCDNHTVSVSLISDMEISRRPSVFLQSQCEVVVLYTECSYNNHCPSLSYLTWKFPAVRPSSYSLSARLSYYTRNVATTIMSVTINCDNHTVSVSLISDMEVSCRPSVFLQSQCEVIVLYTECSYYNHCPSLSYLTWKFPAVRPSSYSLSARLSYYTRNVATTIMSVTINCDNNTVSVSLISDMEVSCRPSVFLQSQCEVIVLYTEYSYNNHSLSYLTWKFPAVRPSSYSLSARLSYYTRNVATTIMSVTINCDNNTVSVSYLTWKFPAVHPSSYSLSARLSYYTRNVATTIMSVTINCDNHTVSVSLISDMEISSRPSVFLQSQCEVVVLYTECSYNNHCPSLSYLTWKFPAVRPSSYSLSARLSYYTRNVATTIMSVTINCDNHTVSVSLISDMEVSCRPSVFLQSQCEVIVLYTECSYYNHVMSVSLISDMEVSCRPSVFLQSQCEVIVLYTNVATTIMSVTINRDNHTVSVSLISDMEVSCRPSVFLQSQCEVIVLYTEYSYNNHCQSLSYLTWKFPAVRPSSYSLSARLSYYTRNVATTIMSCQSLSYLTWKFPAVRPSSYSLSARLSYYTRNVATTIMSVTINCDNNTVSVSYLTWKFPAVRPSSYSLSARLSYYTRNVATTIMSVTINCDNHTVSVSLISDMEVSCRPSVFLQSQCEVIVLYTECSYNNHCQSLSYLTWKFPAVRPSSYSLSARLSYYTRNIATTIMSVTINCDNNTVSVSLISDMEVSCRPSVFLQSQCEVIVLYTECSYNNHCQSLSYLTWKFPAVRPSSYSLSARLSYYTRNVATTIMSVTINCDNNTVSVSYLTWKFPAVRPSSYSLSARLSYYTRNIATTIMSCQSLSYLTWKFPAVRPSSYSLSARLSYYTRNVATTIMSVTINCDNNTVSVSYLTWKFPAVRPSSYSLSARLSYYTRNVATTIMSVTINCDNNTVSVSLISDMEVSCRPSVFLQSQCEVIVLYTECSYNNHCPSLSYLTWKFPAVRPSSYSLSARLSYYTRNVATTIMSVTINRDNHTVSVSLISDMEVSCRPSVFLQSQCEVIVLYTECSYNNHCPSLSYLTWKFPAVRPSSYSLSARLSYYTRNVATTIMSVTINRDNHTVSVSLISDMEVSCRSSVFLQSQCEVIVLYTECSYNNHCPSLSYLTWKFPAVRPSSYSLSARLSYYTRNVATTIMSCQSLSYLTWKFPAVRPSSYSLSARLSYYTRNVATTIMSVTINCDNHTVSVSLISDMEVSCRPSVFLHPQCEIIVDRQVITSLTQGKEVSEDALHNITTLDVLLCYNARLLSNLSL